MPNFVLIVDDNVMVRKGLRCLFESEPEFKVCGEAVDGTDAIEKARTLKPDVIVLDFSMPGGMNGLESARATWSGTTVGDHSAVHDAS